MSIRIDPRPDSNLQSHQFPGWLRVLALVAIPVIAVGMLALGFWQLSRLQARRAENARIESRLTAPPVALEQLDLTEDLAALEYRPVTVRGAFDYEREIVWRNQAYQGAPGVHVVTPLRLADGSAVLVDRGWIPALEADREARSAFRGPAGEVTISGLIRLPGGRRYDFEPQDKLPEGVARLDAWFFLDVSRIQNQIPYPLYPIVVQQSPDPQSRALPLRAYDFQLDDGPHLSYAIQWFAFAAIAIVGPLVYWWRSRSQ